MNTQTSSANIFRNVLRAVNSGKFCAQDMRNTIAMCSDSPSDQIVARTCRLALVAMGAPIIP